MSHAKGYLRDALENLLTERCVDFALDEVVEVGDSGKPKSIRWLLGHLWNCTDMLPGGPIEDWNLPIDTDEARKLATWGALARWLMEERRHAG